MIVLVLIASAVVMDVVRGPKQLRLCNTHTAVWCHACLCTAHLMALSQIMKVSVRLSHCFFFFKPSTLDTGGFESQTSSTCQLIKVKFSRW